ncbi:MULTISPECIES: hypothetical protein [unclassified Mesorhizobium]|uniref:hypothetical protein n=1 Tax=unclassified Mesorhizobium TaxID=325217 RepID=UPI000FD967B9|nr:MULTISPECIES: hypothetical protein [unclassified Mesorhizobium]TGR23120.1 hypothetical protein EN840_21935 [Mesorhizobium sp. M8A.F.Ca.ET.197.01.1.1]TGR39206.1 hypothetical protein EN842_41980 [bacterium M00.F.Ca.ET.199.01.1.1]TGR46799.1 hypothetical protein EN841_21930 [Mesorhizobium sp. M8A.F.Ca.ET.198.01.1.1]TGV85123.1 hypothetical protein EN792_018540 [Mesorhizobium sp. M00.F.Ca.ET.149.01.1.1]
MSAHIVYDSAPLGSVIRYSDGTARPPARFRKKLSSWESRNGTGRLVKKEPPRTRATYSSPGYFTLHEGDFGEGGVVVISVRRTWSVESNLRFEIVERPEIGMVRVLQDVGDSPELLHLSRDRVAADRWLATNPYSRAYLEEVSADEVGADIIEGRTAA